MPEPDLTRPCAMQGTWTDGRETVQWSQLSLTGPMDPGALTILSADERARASRFHFDRDRRRYLLAHVGLRHCLARHTGQAPAALNFRADERGKPRLVSAPGCEFNLSHSANWALVGMGAQAAIGVDIEDLRPLPDALELAEVYFTPRERAFVERAQATHRSTAFLRIWTRKEACLKAVGFGLHLDPLGVEVLPADDGAVATVTDGGHAIIPVTLALPDGAVRLNVQSLELGGDALAAICCVVA